MFTTVYNSIEFEINIYIKNATSEPPEAPQNVQFLSENRKN